MLGIAPRITLLSCISYIPRSSSQLPLPSHPVGVLVIDTRGNSHVRVFLSCKRLLATWRPYTTVAQAMLSGQVQRKNKDELLRNMVILL